MTHKARELIESRGKPDYIAECESCEFRKQSSSPYTLRAGRRHAQATAHVVWLATTVNRRVSCAERLSVNKGVSE